MAKKSPFAAAFEALTYDPDEPPKDIACCPDCSTPLVGTMRIPYCEWYCVECRWSGGLFDADYLDRNADREREADKLEKRFSAIAEGWVTPGSYRTDCDRCKPRDGYHESHLTDEENAAHEAARARLFKKEETDA